MGRLKPMGRQQAVFEPRHGRNDCVGWQFYYGQSLKGLVSVG